MNIRMLLGEVDGKDIIDIGDIVTVALSNGGSQPNVQSNGLSSAFAQGAAKKSSFLAVFL